MQKKGGIFGQGVSGFGALNTGIFAGPTALGIALGEGDDGRQCYGGTIWDEVAQECKAKSGIDPNAFDKQQQPPPKPSEDKIDAAKTVSDKTDPNVGTMPAEKPEPAWYEENLVLVGGIAAVVALVIAASVAIVKRS